MSRFGFIAVRTALLDAMPMPTKMISPYDVPSNWRELKSFLTASSHHLISGCTGPHSALIEHGHSSQFFSDFAVSLRHSLARRIGLVSPPEETAAMRPRLRDGTPVSDNLALMPKTSPTASPNAVAAETHALVVQTQHLVEVTLALVVVALLAMVVPIIVEIARARLRERESKQRARDVIETIAVVLQAQLDAIVNADVTRVGLSASADFLVARILDPDVTRHLPRGSFDLLILAASGAYSVLADSRARLQAAFDDQDNPALAGGERDRARQQLAVLRERAAACVEMLTRLCGRLRQNDTSAFINWETERRRPAS